MFLDRLYSKKGRVSSRTTSDSMSSASGIPAAWLVYKKMYRLKGGLCKELRAICLHPLMLRFLAEGFEGKELPGDMRRIEIFGQYWLRKLEHTGQGDKATAYMFKIVTELKKMRKSDMLRSQLINLLGDNTDALQTVLSKILSENLVTLSELGRR
jgi:hypothetical protein